MSLLRLMLSHKWLLTTLLVVVGAGVCVRLGLWQLERLTLRQAFNTHYREVSALPLLELTSAPADDLTGMEYRAALVSGLYDFEHQVALRNQVYNSQSGYHLLTPLILADGTGILVDRGWVPSEGAAPSAWRAYDQPGAVTVRGILRLGQTEAEIGGVPDPTLAPGQARLEVWNLVNVARIAQQLPYKILPVFVQPDIDPTLTQPPYPAQPVVALDEGPHFGYAMQWFAFAALLFFGYPLLYLRKQVKPEEK